MFFVQLIRSGVNPRSGDPTAWYDRLIRVVGGLILLALLLAVVIVGWVEALRK